MRVLKQTKAIVITEIELEGARERMVMASILYQYLHDRFGNKISDSFSATDLANVRNVCVAERASFAKKLIPELLKKD